MAKELTEPGGKTRLYVESDLMGGTEVTLSDAQTHYLLHVLRAVVGDRVSLFNGRDGEWLAEIRAITKRGCTLDPVQQTLAQSGVPDLWLVFAPIKKTPADYLTQKAAELGVAVLQPMMTRRTIVSRINVERMTANAIEAAEQSGRVSVPEVREAVDFDKLLAQWPTDRQILFCDEGGDAAPIAEALAKAAGAPRRWAVFIGPEGGFDPAERAALRTLPFVTPVTLGPRILRADTAGLAALAVWQSVLGDW
ncbi:MAG: 16S rRNA (uracil(1498)-N(3))-methyltransferase [Rhizomicrobium sp.]